MLGLIEVKPGLSLSVVLAVAVLAAFWHLGYAQQDIQLEDENPFVPPCEKAKNCNRFLHYP